MEMDGGKDAAEFLCEVEKKLKTDKFWWWCFMPLIVTERGAVNGLNMS